MGAVTGLEAKAYRNTGTWAVPVWSEVKNIRDATTNVEKGVADVSTRGSSWKQSKTTMKDGSIELEMVWDTIDAEFTALQSAFFNNTTVEMVFLDGVITLTGSQGLRADFEVADFSRSESLTDALKAKVKLIPARSANAPIWFVTP